MEKDIWISNILHKIDEKRSNCCQKAEFCQLWQQCWVLAPIVMNMYKYDVINVDASGEKHGVTRWTSKNTVVAK